MTTTAFTTQHGASAAALWLPAAGVLSSRFAVGLGVKMNRPHIGFDGRMQEVRG